MLTRSGKNPCSFLWSDVAGLFCKEFHVLASGFVLSSADGRAMAKQSRSPMVSPYHQAETPAPPLFQNIPEINRKPWGSRRGGILESLDPSSFRYSQPHCMESLPEVKHHPLQAKTLRRNLKTYELCTEPKSHPPSK